MAGLDYGAILRGAPALISDPAEDDARALQAQEGKLRLATLMQQYQQGQQAVQRQATLRDLLSGAVDTATGKIDATRVRGAYASLGDLEGLTSFNKSQLDEQKAARDARNAQLDYEVKAFDAVDRSLAGISALPPEQRGAAWAAERQRLAGILDEETLGELPDALDDATIQRFRLHAMDGKERAAAERDERDFAYRQFNDNRNFQRQTAADADASARGWANVEATRANATAMGGLRDLQAQKLRGELDAKAKEREGAAASFDTAIATIDRLRSHKGMGDAVGWQAMFPTLPGGDAANFEAELDALKAQTFLPMVQSLRGMGALSNAEGEKLTNAIGALSTTQSEQAFKTSLGRIKADLMKARARTGAKGASPATPKGGWSIERVN